VVEPRGAAGAQPPESPIAAGRHPGLSALGAAAPDDPLPAAGLHRGELRVLPRALRPLDIPSREKLVAQRDGPSARASACRSSTSRSISARRRRRPPKTWSMRVRAQFRDRLVANAVAHARDPPLGPRETRRDRDPRRPSRCVDRSFGRWNPPGRLPRQCAAHQRVPRPPRASPAWASPSTRTSSRTRPRPCRSSSTRPTSRAATASRSRLHSCSRRSTTPNADAGVNFCTLGAVIGHEITHGFDFKRPAVRRQGNVRDWWAPRMRSASRHRPTSSSPRPTPSRCCPACTPTARSPSARTWRTSAAWRWPTRR
jgi:hypothetical protein